MVDGDTKQGRTTVASNASELAIEEASLLNNYCPILVHPKTRLEDRQTISTASPWPPWPPPPADDGQAADEMIGPQRLPMDPRLLRAVTSANKELLTELLQSVPVENPPAERQPQQQQQIAILVRDSNASHPAAAAGDQQMSCLLGVPPERNTAVHILVAQAQGHRRRGEYLELAEMICQRYSSLVAARNTMLQTPLHISASVGDGQMLSLLLRFADGVDEVRGGERVLRLKNRQGETALHEAVRHDHIKVAQLLIFPDRGLAKMLDKRGASPLYIAAMIGSLDMVKTLLELPSDQLSYVGPGRRNALHVAALKSKGIAEKLLIRCKALAEQVDDSGSTPLHYAASAGNPHIVRLLLSTDAEPAHIKPAYIPDKDGLFPVHIAARNGNELIIAEFIKRCPDCFDLQDKQARNFLHTAVQAENHRAVRHVMRSPALVSMLNARDYQGNTPLHLAVEEQNKSAILSLIENDRVHLSIENAKGQTPLDLAVYRCHPDLKLLTSAGMIIACLVSSGGVMSPRRLDHIGDELRKRDAYRNRDLKLGLAIFNINVTTGMVLIATMTFAALFTLPGGYVSDGGRQDEGTPILARRLAFKGFMVFDTLAFVFSTAATFLLISMAGADMGQLLRYNYRSFAASQYFINFAIMTMFGAFALGLYVVLAPVARAFALVLCMATACSFPLLILSQPQILFLPRCLGTIIKRQVWKGLIGETTSFIPPNMSPPLLKELIISLLIISAGFIFVVIFIWG